MISGSSSTTALVPGQSRLQKQTNKKPRISKTKRNQPHTPTPKRKKKKKKFSPFYVYECFACLYVCPPCPCLVPAEGNSAGAKDGYEPPPLDTEILTLVFPGEMVTAELQPSLSASGLNTNVIFSLCVMSAHILSFF